MVVARPGSHFLRFVYYWEIIVRIRSGPLCVWLTPVLFEKTPRHIRNGECSWGAGLLGTIGFASPAPGVFLGAVQSSGRWSLAQQCLCPPVRAVCTPRKPLAPSAPVFCPGESASPQFPTLLG